VSVISGAGRSLPDVGLGAAIDAEPLGGAPEGLDEDLPALCSDPEANHGDHVSAVARLPADQLGEDPSSRGALVSEAARDQDCDGQVDGSEPDDDPGPDVEPRPGHDPAEQGRPDPVDPGQSESDQRRSDRSEDDRSGGAGDRGAAKTPKQGHQDDGRHDD
jgi:hypothetical protein